MIFYLAVPGQSGSLEQALREAEALVKTLKDPAACARLMQDMPEACAAMDVWHPFVCVRADGSDGQIGLSAVETDEEVSNG